MEDKGKSVAERLREVDGQPGCSPMTIARTAGLDEPKCHDRGCNACLGLTLSALADAIDAELAVAREASARDGMAVIAAAEGWPAMRDGESVVQWMERCWLPRPRYEDGALVEVGDYVDGLDSKTDGISVSIGSAGEPWYTIFDGIDQIEGSGPFKRRAIPLGADGLPINVGDTVWLDREYARYAGKGFYESNKRCGLNGISVDDMIVVERYKADGNVMFGRYLAWCPASWLTHTPPDTQEGIDAEATLPPTAYCAQRGIGLGDDPDRESATTAMIADLLRRQRELDKRMGGE